MRTTIELPEDLRERLILEAARTGVRGFSGIVVEALRQYFSTYPEHDDRESIVRELYGCEKTDGPPEGIATRGTWRTDGK